MPKSTGTPIGDISTLGNQYGRPDIERLGIFSEAGYMIGKKYVSPFPNTITFRGKNMLAGGRKIKNGTQHGYFDDEFRRLFEGEGINWKKARDRKKAAKGAGQAAFMPSGPAKWHSTPGDYYGCFGGIIEHFSNEQHKKPKYERPKPNCLTRPIKQGGPGYANVCLSKDPEHLADPYKPGAQRKRPKKGERTVSQPPMLTMIHPKPYFDNNPFVDPEGKPGSTYIRPKVAKMAKQGIWVPTGPGKWQGGMHGGCFDNFPEWIAGKKQKPRKKVKEPAFYAHSMAIKTMFTTPILYRKVDISISHQNYANYEPTYTKYLLN